MKGPSVAVVVLVYNNVPDTLACIESLRLHEPEAPILIVDNGSAPPFERPAGWDTRIEVLRIANNLGFAGGNNEGIAHAFSTLEVDAVCLLNNDTIITQPFLSVLVEPAYTTTALTGPLIMRKDPPNTVWGIGGHVTRFGRPVMEPVPRSDAPYEVDFLSGCCLCIPRKIWDEVGPLSSDFFLYHEDVDYGLRVKEAGFTSVAIPSISLIHAVSRTSGGDFTPFSTYHLLYGNILLVKKHFHGMWYYAALGYLGVLTVKMMLNLWLYRVRDKKQMISALMRAWRAGYAYHRA